MAFNNNTKKKQNIQRDPSLYFPVLLGMESVTKKSSINHRNVKKSSIARTAVLRQHQCAIRGHDALRPFGRFKYGVPGHARVTNSVAVHDFKIINDQGHHVFQHKQHCNRDPMQRLHEAQFRIFVTQLRVGFLKHTDHHAHETKPKGGAVGKRQKGKKSRNTVRVC
jgi:hypothetical protein